MDTNQEKEWNGDKKSIDIAIKLTLIGVLLVWCAMIILPFVIPVLWGIILSIALFPLYKRILVLFKGRKGFSSTFLTLVMLALIIVPSAWLISSIAENARELLSAIRDKSLVIPPPKPEVAGWPVIGKPVHAAWQLLSTNLEAAVLTYRDQILAVGGKFLTGVKSVVSGLLMFILSIIMSGVFLVNAEKSEKSAQNFAARLFGNTGNEFTDMVVITIRNVAKGILGVAFIQFVLIGATLILAKVPFAGLWAIAVLLFAIVQLPVGIVAIPIIIYFFSEREPLPATLWSILLLVLSISDNVIKPWLMGKGAPVPMLVIFIGAIGGMIMSGFIGLFTGAIVLSIGYKLATVWMKGGLDDKS